VLATALLLRFRNGELRIFVGIAGVAGRAAGRQGIVPVLVAEEGGVLPCEAYLSVGLYSERFAAGGASVQNLAA